ncbi:aminoalkylphosphonic acid N-acetyltransferase [Streptomyces sp. YIM 130001]|uniref:GNAT family N-acetyltransferase n=1 Tax=Streptomyces sp. YIM 130001 TaxID=2259644 RepID=UPI000E653755|nr:GNAT family N-acetyltransferase [Streptomyces sp. YIM 130001]RII22126.1 aminoalkylphosphonic acid N-acetyltransferase [Streptomyces sp. YIM 130001]
MRITDLEPGDPRLAADLLYVLRELRPHLTAELLDEVYGEGHVQGLRFTAAYAEDGACLGVAGWRVVVNTSALRKLYVDDLVTATEARSSGVGRELLAHLEGRARELACHRVELDSGTQRSDAHRFYFRERMHVSGYHFTKPVHA